MQIVRKTSGMYETATDPIDMGKLSPWFCMEAYRAQRDGLEYRKIYQDFLRRLLFITAKTHFLKHKIVGVDDASIYQIEILKEVVDLDDELYPLWAEGYDVSELPLVKEPEESPYAIAETTLRTFLTESKAEFTEKAFDDMWRELTFEIMMRSAPRG